MNKYFQNMMRSVLLVFSVILVVPALAEDSGATRSIDDLALIMGNFHQEMSDDKRRLVEAKMNLSEDEAKVFWPIYDDYQKDLYKIVKRLAKIVDIYDIEYSKGVLSDKIAEKLLIEALDIELVEVKLKQSYVPRFGKKLPMAKVARYIQIETKIRVVIYHKIATKIPLVEYPVT